MAERSVVAVNAAIFTVVDSVLLQPLPYPEPDRLMQLGGLYPNNNDGFSNSIPKYMVWRQNEVFDSMTLFGQGGPGMNLGSGDRPEQIKSLRASEGYFKVFGVAPMIGRTYTPSFGSRKTSRLEDVRRLSQADGDPQVHAASLVESEKLLRLLPGVTGESACAANHGPNGRSIPFRTGGGYGTVAVRQKI